MRNLSFAALSSAMLFAAAAQADFVYATNVEGFTQGPADGGSVEPVRSNPLNALGAPQNNNTVNFVSLGQGGSLILSFGTMFHNQVIVTETTYPPINQHFESAQVWVGVGSTAATATWWLAGTVLNTADNTPMSLAGAHSASGLSAFKYVKIVDTTNFATSTSYDGFDVDAVGVLATTVPTPASVTLASLGGVLIAARRRRA